MEEIRAVGAAVYIKGRKVRKFWQLTINGKSYRALSVDNVVEGGIVTMNVTLRPKDEKEVLELLKEAKQ